MSPDLGLITSSVKKSRRFGIFAGGVVFVFGIGLAAVQFRSPYPPETGIITIGVIIALLGLAGTIGALSWYNPSKLLKVLTGEPEQIVWIYVKEQVVTTGGVERSKTRELCIGLYNGRVYYIPVDKENIERVFQTVQGIAPEAVVGYDRDLESSYRQSPEHFLSRFGKR